MTDIEQPANIETQEETPRKTPLPGDGAGLYLSLNEASRRSQIPKGTISKDATKGKIQWHERPDGTRKLHAAEVFSFYADRIKQREMETGNASEKLVSITTVEQPKHTLETELNKQIAIQLAEAQAEARHLKERLNDKTEQVEDLRIQRDKLMEQNHRLTLMLPAPLTQSLPVEETAPETALIQPRRSFWKRVMGQ